MRELFLTELVKEVLGPRDGINEVLENSPLNEYITGVLAPELGTEIPQIESDAELPTEDTSSHEEDAPDQDVDTPPLFSPALNPKNRPTTMGLSFVLEPSEKPMIEVCITWARYEFYRSENGLSHWRRQPRSSVFPLDVSSNQALNIDDQGRLVSESRAEVSLNVATRLESGRYLVTLFLMNKIMVNPDDLVTSEDHIFQPQIRVICQAGTRIVSGVRSSAAGEEKVLEFLYRERKVLARGHLTSAVWREIDPENFVTRMTETNIDSPSTLTDIPFKWIDGFLPQISEEDRKRFSNPEVRTEFVPIYSIPSPDLYWDTKYGKEPECHAEALAECWDGTAVSDALTPLIQGYENWVASLRKQIPSFDDGKEIAENLVGTCQTVLDRMKMGLKILREDVEARLAFCFANKAMDIQSRWSPRHTNLTWYPYQLAYILLCIESVANARSKYRAVCDLIWVQTGAGKTEAYMGIMAFTLALRRRRELSHDAPGDGVSVISRYTLRLLTIQQFRRTVALISACELLRTMRLSNKKRVGWRPDRCSLDDNFLWGSASFSVGLWVGGEVTPNRLASITTRDGTIPGALEILNHGSDRSAGEPAQILKCPSCEAILAIPDMGLSRGRHTLFLVVKKTDIKSNLSEKLAKLNGTTIFGVKLLDTKSTPHSSQRYETLQLNVDTGRALDSAMVDSLWEHIRRQLSTAGCNLELIPARASRPGYFIRWYYGSKQQRVDFDFDIICPNPDPSACQLHSDWCAGAPMGWICGVAAGAIAPSNTENDLSLPDGNSFIHIPEPFQNKNPYFSDRIPITAMTVDDQIYQRIPSVIVATVDKFARPPFESRASAIFGNVEFHSSVGGFYRLGLHPRANESGHPTPVGRSQRTYSSTPQRPPPDLIVQDELHLIEGPLGSLVGIYETAIDFLCKERVECQVKYVASTATIRRAQEQVQAVFVRDLQIFPPPGLTFNDRFFIREEEINPLLDSKAGRLYVGISAPGKGPLTPLVRIWSKLMQTTWNLRNETAIDRFWTLTGYFNAVRELAGARALYRQDIPLRVNEIGGRDPRPLPDEKSMELSSRSSSTDLPGILDVLSTPGLDAPDALFTTSMFGTGVDIPRIGLMVVNGQPKTTSAYIQSTGRVGRNSGALVISFFRAARPRDLSHYEFFCGYHRQLHRFVEPVTVFPFSPNALERAAGPVSVFVLRNRGRSNIAWYSENSASQMAAERSRSPEVQNLPGMVESRSQLQPVIRRPSRGYAGQFIGSELDRWQQFASNQPNLQYVEYAISMLPTKPVVLGDAQHKYARLPEVYRNAPQSLRDIEETTGFQT